MRNGNFKKVRNLCKTLHRLHGDKLRRKHVMEAARQAGIPAPTASEVWQEWRLKNDL